jgi:hypothetical protein
VVQAKRKVTPLDQPEPPAEDFEKSNRHRRSVDHDRDVKLINGDR